jgi:hypothetical protein
MRERRSRIAALRASHGAGASLQFGLASPSPIPPSQRVHEIPLRLDRFGKIGPRMFAIRMLGIARQRVAEPQHRTTLSGNLEFLERQFE